MVSRAEKKNALKSWAIEFPSYTMWRNQFLLKRHGCLLIGICLDTLRDGDYYRPTLFVHNFAVEFPIITLNCSVFLIAKHSYVRIRYSSIKREDILKSKTQVDLLNKDNLSFSDFVMHIEKLHSGYYGQTHIHTPFVLRDLISIGFYGL